MAGSAGQGVELPRYFGEDLAGYLVILDKKSLLTYTHI